MLWVLKIVYTHVNVTPMIIQKSSVPGARRWLSHLSIPLLISAKVMISLFFSLSPCSRNSRSLLGIIPLYLFLCASPTLSFCLPPPHKKVHKKRTIPSAPRIPSCWITVTPPLRPGNHLSPNLISYKWIVMVGKLYETGFFHSTSCLYNTSVS